MHGSGRGPAVALAALVASGALAWLTVGRQRAEGPVRLVDNTDSVRELLERRASEAPALPAAGGLRRETIPEDEARRMFSMPERVFEYDPHTFFRYRANLASEEEFADHPGGRFEKRTNSLGLREDGELPERRDLLVIAAGDSHTDGLCANRDGFPALLEEGLRESRPGEVVEVLNTGVAGYGFWNYLGVLEKLAHLEPDAFVVVFYGGNDYLDMLKPWHYFNRSKPPPRTREYWEKIEIATRVSSAGLANAFNELLYFQYYPDEMEVALRAAIEVSAEIARQCRERGILLMYVYLPPGFEVGGELDGMLAAAKEALKLSDQDLRIYDRITDRFLGAIEDLKIDVIDLRGRCVDPIESYYWSDLHINLKGHALVAEALLPRLEAALSAGD